MMQGSFLMRPSSAGHQGKLRVGVGIVFADVLDDGIVIEIIQNRIEDFAVGSGGFDNLDGGDISIGVGLAVVDALLLLDKAVIAFHFGVDLAEDIAAGGVKLRGVADDFIHGLVDFITPGDGGRIQVWRLQQQRHLTFAGQVPGWICFWGWGQVHHGRHNPWG